MVPSIEQPAVKTSLLAIAILAGMATAAAIVLLMAVHHGVLAHSAAAGQSTQTARPSPFATAASSLPPPEVNLAPPQIAKAGNQALVVVTGYDGNDQPLGQARGYVYSAGGMIVTSYSAIRGASSVAIDTANGRELNVIALMGYSPNQDLAVLAVLEGNLPALENGASETVQEGEPTNLGAVGPRRAFHGVDLIQINGRAAPGSPVLNRHGKVIGLMTNRPAGAGATYAIPLHYVSDLLAERHTMSFAQMLEETGYMQPVAKTEPAP